MGGPGHRLRYVTGGGFLLSGFVLHLGSGADLVWGDTACNLLLLATSTLGYPLVDEIFAVRAVGVVLTGNGDTGVGFLVLNIC
ncbi:hypothetical protein M413DRAFT_438798, partial [Hebeloma cylindrosporum]